ncbi:UvrD-helicase domain-containing protein [Variovorax sp. dw_954]|uniref:UvrD-helicase domain-containing protein n=1 Tax=Variovorax sp. dw_954 TaxID=2720078 RepID=UPI001BD4E7B6|nr:UvrD-helicase domain-containing protein [Variovorax sp. dw_954]
MNPIGFISAGAGSGKTYRLTSVLSDALRDATNPARPHAVLATTFTVKAATELRERVRDRLLSLGRMDLVTAAGQARIGTVNAICGQLLQRFCFEVGISPDQTVLSDGQTRKMLATALDDTLDAESRAELASLTRRFGIEDANWAEIISNVVQTARSNDISEADLRPMGPANADLMLANWPAPQADVDYTSRLVSALAQAESDVRLAIEAREAAGAAVAKNMQAGLTELQKLLRGFQGTWWSWPDWLAACKIDAGAPMRALVQPVADAGQAHEYHPQFHEDVRRYLDLVFNLAADALNTYARAKREAGVVDFNDQEVLLLHALRNSEAVRAALADELDLVLVDEFQDTSPLQLALFVELAKLAKKSVWVGDPKQAIYGFRGTDASLITGVIDAIKDWGGEIGAPLTISRRSAPALVQLANAVFVPAFSNTLNPSAVELQPSRQDIPNQPALYDWTFESPRGELDYLGLGPALTDLLAAGTQVLDKATNQLRPLQVGDMAVLCRTNEQVGYAVAALARWGIPTSSGRSGLLTTPEALLVLACLRRLHDASDTAATALILALAEGMPANEWLSDRLDHLAAKKPSHEWKATGEETHPLVARLEALRPALLSLTPTEALRLAKAESHVARVCSQWSSTPQQARMRIANVEALQALATTYEEDCTSSKRPATVGGLLRWLGDLADGGDDARAEAAEDAVTVTTHHRAKGLEWPVVVLSGLDKGARSDIWGVRARTNGAFDAKQPLLNRFVHCWPKTYGRRKAPQAALNAESSPIGKRLAEAGFEENKRLFYVAMTRARDAVILMSAKKKSPARAWVDEIGASALLFGASGPVALPNGSTISRATKELNANECATQPPAEKVAPRYWFSPGNSIETQPLWFRPSSAEGGAHQIKESERVGTRIAITAAVDMANLGSALHHCIAYAGVAGSIAAADVQRLLTRWQVAHAVTTDAVLAQVEALLAWIAKRWPGCPMHVEVPIEANRADGQRLRGRIDFLVDTPEGWILVDHKSNPRGAAHDDDLVRDHAPQLASYADALTTATGRPVREQWLFLPVAARAVQVQAKA